MRAVNRQPWFPRAGLAEMAIGKTYLKTIVVYTLPYCEHCQSLKGALNFMKIPYIMVDAHEDVATASRLEGKLNTKSYPIVEFPSDSIFNPIFKNFGFFLFG